MKKLKFSDSQIIEALKRVEGGRIVGAGIVPEAGDQFSDVLQVACRVRGMDTSLMARMKEGEAENARLNVAAPSSGLPRDVLRDFTKIADRTCAAGGPAWSYFNVKRGRALPLPL